MSAKNPTPPVAKQNFRILVIEDEIHIARLVQENMSKAGFTCRTEHSGLAGLNAFQQMRPHLIVLDLILPDITGYEVCARLRQVSTVPIVMLTARDGAEDQLHGFKLGADDYVTKPFDPKLMMARVVAQLRRVYRYDVVESNPEDEEMVTATRNVPDGWVGCDGCNYMGPREKFEDLNNQGMVVLTCPHCDSRITQGILVS